MGEFDPVSWDTVEAVLGAPTVEIGGYVDRLAPDVRDEEPFVAVKTVYDAWKRDLGADRTLPDQGAAFVVAYCLERDGVISLDADEERSAGFGARAGADAGVGVGSLVDRRPDRERLRELVWEREETMWWIAVRYGVHWTLVNHWLYEDDIPLMERNFGEESLARIRAHREGED